MPTLPTKITNHHNKSWCTKCNSDTHSTDKCWGVGTVSIIDNVVPIHSLSQCFLLYDTMNTNKSEWRTLYVKFGRFLMAHCTAQAAAFTKVASPFNDFHGDHLVDRQIAEAIAVEYGILRSFIYHEGDRMALEFINAHLVEQSREMNDNQMMEAFAKVYKNDAANIEIAKHNNEYWLKSIVSRNRYTAFKEGIKAATAHTSPNNLEK